MANWASTAYAIEGPKETLEKIYEAIMYPDKSEGDEGWEGWVLKALGISWEDKGPDGKGLYMRGFIQDEPWFDGNTLRLCAEEAWGATDFNIALEKAFPNIKVFYSVEECDEEIYATNDKEGKYFPDRFYVDACFAGDYQMEYFTNEESMFRWIAKNTHGEVDTLDKVVEFNEFYEDEGSYDTNYINIHKFDIVE